MIMIIDKGIRLCVRCYAWVEHETYMNISAHAERMKGIRKHDVPEEQGRTFDRHHIHMLQPITAEKPSVAAHEAVGRSIEIQ